MHLDTDISVFIYIFFIFFSRALHEPYNEHLKVKADCVGVEQFRLKCWRGGVQIFGSSQATGFAVSHINIFFTFFTSQIHPLMRGQQLHLRTLAAH